MTAKIYIEGGGDGHFLDTLFRQAWTAFFKSAGLTGRMPRVVRGKGRRSTFDLFRTAVAKPRPGEVPLLLVDSEGPLAAGSTPWQHLAARRDDQWERPDGAGEDQAFLMVQLMETWFLADRDLLRRYFGPDFREEALRQWRALEQVPKATVLAALEHATTACPTPYAKGRVSFELLGRLNPVRVEQACPNAKRLLDRLRGLEPPSGVALTRPGV